MQLNTSFACNCVVWVRSLHQFELGLSRRITEDLESLFARIGVGFEVLEVNDVSELTSLLHEIEYLSAQNGVRPLMHFDMHGDNDKGLFLCEALEYLAWDEVVGWLSRINTATKNNLCVLGAGCYGFKAIDYIKIRQITPFFVFLAPEKKVSAGFLEDNLPKFYGALFESGEIDAAFNCYLSSEFEYYHCEKMLFVAMARYVISGCKGKSASARRERLLTEVLAQGMPNTKQNRRLIRQQVKSGLLPGQALLDRYAEKFLLNKKCSFSMLELLGFIERYYDPLS